LFSISGVLISYFEFVLLDNSLDRVSGSNTRFSMFFVSLGCISLIDVVGALPIYKKKCAFAFMFRFWDSDMLTRSIRALMR
jgi:hypothetical protein